MGIGLETKKKKREKERMKYAIKIAYMSQVRAKNCPRKKIRERPRLCLVIFSLPTLWFRPEKTRKKFFIFLGKIPMI